MAKLKLGEIGDEKPVKVTLELPAALQRDLVAYADILSKETVRPVGDAATLIAPMIERFMSTDRGFARTGGMVAAGCRYSGIGGWLAARAPLVEALRRFDNLLARLSKRLRAGAAGLMPLHVSAKAPRRNVAHSRHRAQRNAYLASRLETPTALKRWSGSSMARWHGSR